VDKQTTLIKQRLKRHQSSSPTLILKALNQLSKGAQVMAAFAALQHAQITTLQKANEAMHVRRTRTRKALVSDKALSVSEVQAMGGYEEVKAEIIEEMLRPKKRRSRCSKCGEEGHTCRTYSN
jgi:formylmethanofuran dehydrogenase subunit E